VDDIAQIELSIKSMLKIGETLQPQVTVPASNIPISSNESARQQLLAILKPESTAGSSQPILNQGTAGYTQLNRGSSHGRGQNRGSSRGRGFRGRGRGYSKEG
jgi:hypothetical protein